ncbi:hypothetical protein BD289DRAFT_142073 [Coniella lustricola]|uniref:Uncharacterized protein n=1 Tax=Coniella lustricola TaxID=2025994 RepID=A0A2T2ZVA6_9PEZI|nr:hypothetical protein BD289DRAFT_142073 [Coniella lustricola]
MSKQPVISGYLGANNLWYLTRRDAISAGTTIVAAYTAKGPVAGSIPRSRGQQSVANPLPRPKAPAAQGGQLYRSRAGGYVPTVELLENIFDDDEVVEAEKRYGLWGKNKNGEYLLLVLLRADGGSCFVKICGLLADFVCLRCLLFSISPSVTREKSILEQRQKSKKGS